ncbi:MAG TPA: TolC family protein [Rhodothermales bacterium]|nr:TolC family protein [Rhodothermales bacterium]
MCKIFFTSSFSKSILRARFWRLVLVAAVCCTAHDAPAQPRQVINLTLDTTMDLALGNSYRVRQLELGIEETRSWLKAERAGLKSRVYVELATPEFEAISESKWNSDLRRNEIVHTNTRLWQANFSIRQPVVLFGHPTDGYLSFNNRVYRYTQLEGGNDVTYYNRYFLKFEQPLFQPNELKNDIKSAELNLKEANLEFQEDVVDLLDDVADDYFDLLRESYNQVIYTRLVDDLTQAEAAASDLAARDTTRTIELRQIRVELANAREHVKQTRSDIRLQSSALKRRLRLQEQDSIYVDPVLTVTPVEVDLQQAIHYGQTLRPALKKLDVQMHQDEIDIENTKGDGDFRANLEMTYGREMQNPLLQDLFDEPANSYTVGLHAYIPIWDWGQRSARVQAQQINLRQTELSIEEAKQEIQTDITNAVLNLNEYQQRAVTMQANLELARQIAQQSLSRYRAGTIGALELLQSFNRERDTADNFLDTYLGYRRALLSLKTSTYYDFENGAPLLQHLEVSTLPDDL